MAEPKKAAAPAADPALEKVDFYAFKDSGKYKDDIMVGVNGKSFRIKRGVHVKIPRYVAEVLENSMEQDAYTANLIDKGGKAYSEASRFL